MPALRDIYDALVERFGSEIIVGINETAIDPWIEIAAAAIAEVGQFLRDDPHYRFDHLNDLTAVDYQAADPAKAARFPFEPHVEIVYHLSSYETRRQIVLKVNLPRWENDAPGAMPHIPSVANVWPAADWHEREAYDLMGIWFAGHPNLVRIFMPEDWPGHPLRKDYVWPEEYHGIRTQ